MSRRNWRWPLPSLLSSRCKESAPECTTAGAPRCSRIAIIRVNSSTLHTGKDSSLFGPLSAAPPLAPSRCSPLPFFNSTFAPQPDYITLPGYSCCCIAHLFCCFDDTMTSRSILVLHVDLPKDPRPSGGRTLSVTDPVSCLDQHTTYVVPTSQQSVHCRVGMDTMPLSLTPFPVLYLHRIYSI